MKYLKQIFSGDIRQYTMVIALVVFILVFHIASGGKVITPSNFQNLISGYFYVLLMALGMLMVIVIGQIDLSVGSVAAFTGMFLAITARDLGFPWWLAILASLIVGVAIGSLQGFWLSKLNVPGFITTLGGMMIFRGATIWISGSKSVPVPEELKIFGAGYLPDWGRELTGLNNLTLLLGIIGIAIYAFIQLRRRSRSAEVTGVKEGLWLVVLRIVLVGAVIGFLAYTFASGRKGTSFPVPGVTLIILIVFYQILTQRTRFGRSVYAVGGNKNAARLSGVNVPKTYFLTMLNMSVLATLAGIMFVGRTTAAGPADGNMWELDVIASVFIGGAAVSGGIGTVPSTMVGGMVMVVLSNGLQLLGVGADRTAVIKGCVLLIAVAFDILNKQQGRPSITGRLFPKKENPEEKAMEGP
ncbi:MAG: sugar ABC transporter permease [Coriobacteriales bacterium]|jgi:putative multiple sugar transport system permease protein|nr:sugar ABC transporter permease [Coriobacteriales bacterium]